MLLIIRKKRIFFPFLKSVKHIDYYFLIYKIFIYIEYKLIKNKKFFFNL